MQLSGPACSNHDEDSHGEAVRVATQSMNPKYFRRTLYADIAPYTYSLGILPYRCTRCTLYKQGRSEKKQTGTLGTPHGSHCRAFHDANQENAGVWSRCSDLLFSLITQSYAAGPKELGPRPGPRPGLRSGPQS